MEVTINVPDKVAAEARAHGVSVKLYVEAILAQRALDTTGKVNLELVRAAIHRIIELRKGNTLAGLHPKDLIHEGHRY